MTTRPAATTPTPVTVLDGVRTSRRSDVVATEEPLEIRIAAAANADAASTVAVTMRTPGHDFDLAAGFLFTEGIVRARTDVRRIDYCAAPGGQLYNTVTVHLPGTALPPLDRLQRYGTVSSACGVCGKSSVDALEVSGLAPFEPGFPKVAAATLFGLPNALRGAQSAFDRTGGLHAAGLFTADGEARCVREDIGRHNAVDKVAGWSLLRGDVPAGEGVLVVSGRASFEIVQKAVAARIPVVCAVSAPSSLAVATAQRFNVTLVAFLRGTHANAYSGAERLGG